MENKKNTTHPGKGAPKKAAPAAVSADGKVVHPENHAVTARCVCGNSIATRSTLSKIEVEICSNCHPFFTGTQKFVDTAGRFERFQNRYTASVAKPAKR